MLTLTFHIAPACFDPDTADGQARQSRLASSSRRLVFGSTVGLAVWSLLMWLGRHEPATFSIAIGQLTRSLTSAVFLTAGAMRCAAWRLTRSPQALWNAMALIVIGLTLPMVTAVRLSVHGSPTDAATALARLLMVFAVLALTAVALLAGPTAARYRPIRAVAILLTLFGITTTVALILGPPTGAPNALFMPIFRGAEWVATALWTVLALTVLRLGRRQHRAPALWGAAGLGLMATTELAQTLAMSGSFRLVDFAVGLQLLAAALTACAAAVGVSEAFTASDKRTDRLSDDLLVVRAGLADTERRERERLHDARTAMVGLMGASRILAQSTPDDGLDRIRLHNMMAAELARVGVLLDPATATRITAFRVADALEPVIVAHRLAGVQLDVNADDSWAIGDARSTATVTANLLANAAKHAPGARVTVSTETVGPVAIIRITDDGPGIPAADRTLVLESGARGSTAGGTGSGLGLHTARRAMQEQGGSLDLIDDGRPGTKVQITLPATVNPASLLRLTSVIPQPVWPRDLVTRGTPVGV